MRHDLVLSNTFDDRCCFLVCTSCGRMFFRLPDYADPTMNDCLEEVNPDGAEPEGNQSVESMKKMKGGANVKC